MNGLFCKHQETMVDDNSGVTVSACRNSQAAHFQGIISELICKDCRLLEEPSAEDQQFCMHMQEQRGGDVLETRRSAERARILETYCFKCKHCDSVDRVCNACNCNIKLPADDYVKYVAHHCPLELW